MIVLFFVLNSTYFLTITTWRLWPYDIHYICINYSIPVGKNNRYGHPNKEVLDNLEKSKIYIIDKDGSIMFKIKNNKLRIDDKYNYIDLLLYNIKYKCHVVVELKVTELKKEHTGQIMTYMNYINKNIKTIKENDTVGIIICKQDNEYVIKYCFDDRIIAREYELVWYNFIKVI